MPKQRRTDKSDAFINYPYDLLVKKTKKAGPKWRRSTVDAEDPRDAGPAIVRPAEAADMDQVFSLTAEFSTSFRPDMASFRPSFLRLIDHPDALLLVALQSGRVSGYLLGFDHDTLFANGRVAWIEELMVHQEHRRHGIGTQLVERFEHWAKSRGNRLTALATRRAESFYCAIGYEQSAAYYRNLI